MSRCRLCDRVWPMNYEWRMKHVEGRVGSIWIRKRFNEQITERAFDRKYSGGRRYIYSIPCYTRKGSQYIPGLDNLEWEKMLAVDTQVEG